MGEKRNRVFNRRRFWCCDIAHSLYYYVVSSTVNISIVWERYATNTCNRGLCLRVEEGVLQAQASRVANARMPGITDTCCRKHVRPGSIAAENMVAALILKQPLYPTTMPQC